MMQAELDFAKAARDDGIARSVAHAEAESPGWADLAYAFLCRYARSHARFQIWQAVADSRGEVPQAANERAWGGPTLKALHAGVIAKDGFAPNPKRHATAAPVYRSLV